MNNALGCYECLEDAFQALLEKAETEEVEAPEPSPVTYLIRLAGSERHTEDFADWLAKQGHDVYTGRNRNTIDNRCCVADDWANNKILCLWSEFEAQKNTTK